MRARALYEEGESVYNKTEESYWLSCPKCGKNVQPMLEDTMVQYLPLQCPKCKLEFVIVNIGRGKARAAGRPVQPLRGASERELLDGQCQS